MESSLIIQLKTNNNNLMKIFNSNVTLPLFLMLLCMLLGVSSRSLHFSLPYRTLSLHTDVQHLAKVEINRYSYDIDFTLLSQQDHILPLQLIAQTKIPSDRPDYRKNQESVFGIVEFYGTERADERLEWKRRLAYNLYYFGRDFMPRLTWMNLKGVKQVEVEGEGVDGKREGAFNFGPRNTGSELLRNFRKYSKYMGDTIVVFKGNLEDEDGQIIFGEFPPQYVVNEEIHSSNLQYLGQQYWMMSTTGLTLHRKNGKFYAPVDLYRETVKVRLTLSERTVIIPLPSAQAMLKALPKCKFEELAVDGKNNRFLACRDMKNDEMSELAFNFTIKDAVMAVSIRFKDILVLEEGGTRWFAVKGSENEEYQIGEAILRQYAVGIDYKDGRLMFGRLSPQSSISRFTILKAFLAFNIILFLISAVLVIFQKSVRERMKVAVKDEFFNKAEQYSPSKANSYELASVSEQSFNE